MATEELSLDDIAAYLETFEPCPALWSFSTLDDSDLDDLHTLLEPSGDPQPAQSENHEQEQQTDPEAPELKSNASSSNGESDLRTIYHDTEQQQNDTTRSNPQPWWSETHEWLLDTVIPERSPQNSNCSSSDEVNNTNSSCQANQQRQRKTKPRKPTTRAKRSRNPSREKMQDELKTLRVQSKELHEQLAMLQEHQKRDMLRAAFWKCIAKQRLEARTIAERKNRRLKTTLGKQMTLRQSFELFVSQLESAMPSLPAPANAIDSRRDVVIDADDISIFESLFLELDATYSKMDAVFNENGLNAWQVGMSTDIKAQMKTRRSNIATDADSLYIEFIDTNVVPFPLELVFNTLWECWDRQSGERSCSMYQFPGEPESSCGMKVRIDICFNGQHVALDFLSVSKLFIEDGRRIFVWRSRTKVHPQFPGTYIDEMGWQVINSVEVPGSEDFPGNVTEILSCSRLECKELDGSLNAHDQDHGTDEIPLASLVVSAFEEVTVQINEMMMNMLLQDKTPASITPCI
ncbi:hypothetical protein FI667_g2899, partial [Globisporangium splendens]